MTLERKDIRAKLCPDYHAALHVLAEIDECDIGEWIERVVRAEIERRCHAASVIAGRVQHLGIAGNRRESPGTRGSGRE